MIVVMTLHSTQGKFLRKFTKSTLYPQTNGFVHRKDPLTTTDGSTMMREVRKKDSINTIAMESNREGIVAPL
jgi:hypothetical protein